MDRSPTRSEMLREQAKRELEEHFDTRHSHKEIIRDSDMYNMASGEELRQRAESDPTFSRTAGYTGPIENVGGSADTAYPEEEDRRGLGARTKRPDDSQQDRRRGLGVPGSRSFPQDEESDARYSNLISAQHGLGGQQKVVINRMSSSERLERLRKGEDLIPRAEDEYDLPDTLTREPEDRKDEFIDHNQFSPEDAANLASIEARRTGGITPQGSLAAKAQSKADRTQFERNRVEEYESRVVVDQNDPRGMKERAQALQSFESKLYGHQLKGGLASQAQANAEHAKRKYNETYDRQNE